MIEETSTSPLNSASVSSITKYYLKLRLLIMKHGHLQQKKEDSSSRRTSITHVLTCMLELNSKSYCACPKD